MKSIQTKIVVLIVMVVILCSGVVGGISVWHLKTVSDQNSAQIMNLSCREEGKKLEHIFYSVEQSVKIIAHNATKNNRMDKIIQDDYLRVMYMEEMRPILLAAAKSTEGAVAVYYHLNPEIAPSDAGLFYSKTLFSQNFLVQKVTDLAKANTEDNGALDWYYKAVESKEPVWLEPYNNGKIEEDVVSYVVPVYQNDLLLGVVGMDILFSDITKEIADVKLYENGLACLISKSGKVLYHPTGKPEYSIDSEEEWERFVESATHNAIGNNTFDYKKDGKIYRLSYYQMENGMSVILSAPTSEIGRENNQMVKNVMISVVWIVIICIAGAYVMGQSIISPLVDLTKAAREMANGNLKIKLPTGTQDEVGILSASMQQMVDCLCVYMDRMNDLAYTDPLTGVKSKIAYTEEVAKIEKSVEEGVAQFGVVFFDLNNLKVMNDTYGHEAGDRYIKGACRLICTTYKHSPVYRIGGDEFVAILRGSDLLNGSKLIKRFYDRMEIVNRDAENPSEKVSVAAGMAVFKEGEDADFQSVFKRADENMYMNKKAIKSGGEPNLKVERLQL